MAACAPLLLLLLLLALSNAGAMPAGRGPPLNAATAPFYPGDHRPAPPLPYAALHPAPPRPEYHRFDAAPGFAPGAFPIPSSSSPAAPFPSPFGPPGFRTSTDPAPAGSYPIAASAYPSSPAPSVYADRSLPYASPPPAASLRHPLAFQSQPAARSPPASRFPSSSSPPYAGAFALRSSPFGRARSSSSQPGVAAAAGPSSAPADRSSSSALFRLAGRPAPQAPIQPPPSSSSSSGSPASPPGFDLWASPIQEPLWNHAVLPAPAPAGSGFASSRPFSFFALDPVGPAGFLSAVLDRAPAAAAAASAVPDPVSDRFHFCSGGSLAPGRRTADTDRSQTDSSDSNSDDPPPAVLIAAAASPDQTASGSSSADDDSQPAASVGEESVSASTDALALSDDDDDDDPSFDSARSQPDAIGELDHDADSAARVGADSLNDGERDQVGALSDADSDQAVPAAADGDSAAAVDEIPAGSDSASDLASAGPTDADSTGSVASAGADSPQSDAVAGGDHPDEDVSSPPSDPAVLSQDEDVALSASDHHPPESSRCRGRDLRLRVAHGVADRAGLFPAGGDESAGETERADRVTTDAHFEFLMRLAGAMQRIEFNDVFAMKLRLRGEANAAGDILLAMQPEGVRDQLAARLNTQEEAAAELLRFQDDYKGLCDGLHAEHRERHRANADEPCGWPAGFVDDLVRRHADDLSHCECYQRFME